MLVRGLLSFIVVGVRRRFVLDLGSVLGMLINSLDKELKWIRSEDGGDDGLGWVVVVVFVKRVVFNMKFVIDLSIEKVKAVGLGMVVVVDGKKGDVMGLLLLRKGGCLLRVLLWEGLLGIEGNNV